MTSNSFIFSINLPNINNIPVSNIYNSFIDLSYNTEFTNDELIVSVTWSSFNRNHINDGLSFFQWNNGKNIKIIKFNNIPLTSNGSQFRNFTGSIIATDKPQCFNNLSCCFSYSNINPCNISSWDVSNVTNMNSMFYCATCFNHDISLWDVSNVTNMEQMFCRATCFNQDISKWKVSHNTNTNAMFANALNFNKNINNWNVPHPDKLYYLNYSSFNQDIHTI